MSSTRGSFLRAPRFGDARQVDAVVSRFMLGLDAKTTLLCRPGDDGTVTVDIDGAIIGVRGHQRQDAAFGYSGVRGVNAVLATGVTHETGPVWWPRSSCRHWASRRSVSSPISRSDTWRS